MISSAKNGGVYKSAQAWYNENMKRIAILLLCLCLLAAPAAGAERHAYLPEWAEGALSVPEGVVSIEHNAFEDVNVTGVVLPGSLASVGANVFANCESLERICILSENASFGPNALGAAGENKEIWGFLGSTAEEYAEEYGYTFVRLYTYEEELMSYAASKLGTKYVRGSWDCVLYVRDCYLHVFGIRLPDSCIGMQYLSSSYLVPQQHLTVTRITDITQLKTGDILCWKNDEVSYCTHVGMYVGEGTYNGHHYSSGIFIENSQGAGKVRYNYIPSSGSSYYYRNFICAWRVLP